MTNVFILGYWTDDVSDIVQCSHRSVLPFRYSSPLSLLPSHVRSYFINIDLIYDAQRCVLSRLPRIYWLLRHSWTQPSKRKCQKLWSNYTEEHVCYISTSINRAKVSKRVYSSRYHPLITDRDACMLQAWMDWAESDMHNTPYTANWMKEYYLFL